MDRRKRKRRAEGDGNGSGGELVRVGLWETMSPQILALVLVLIPVEEVVRVVPLVCKAWREALCGPYCWAEIDLEHWCRRCNKTHRIDAVVRRLVRRSKGTCSRLSAFKLGDPAFSSLLSCTKCLKVLQIPMSQASDKMVKKHAPSLKMLTFLDISNCLKITCDGLETLGKTCTSLIHLKRNMPPPGFNEASRATNDGEALVIAETMPKLQYLELGFGRLTDIGVNAILSKCLSLTHLDIQGCWGVRLDGDLEDKCYQLVKFIDPWFNDYELAESSEQDDSDYRDAHHVSKSE